MTEIIGAILALLLGALLFIVSGGFIIYYCITKKGKLALSIVGLCLSIILMGGGFFYLIYTSVSKANEKKGRNWSIVANSYSLGQTEKRILDTQTFEDSDADDINLIVQAATCIFRNKKEKVKYEPKIKDFYTKYLESVGYSKEDAIKYYEQAREHVDKLERSIN